MSVVFVTGGSGFIGGRLIERLGADGHTVRALARSDQAAARIRERGREPGRVRDRRGSPPVRLGSRRHNAVADDRRDGVLGPLCLDRWGRHRTSTTHVDNTVEPVTRFAYWISSQECTIRIDKAPEQLGYQPVRSIPDGLQELRSAA